MDSKKLVPYSLYIPKEHYEKLKEAAKERKASELIRDAIAMIFDGGDAYKSGYNQAIREAVKIVYDCPEAQMVAVKGRDIGDILSERIEGLEKK